MRKKLPPIGARIIKSTIAVALCMIVYFIRSMLPIGNGIPFYSALAALWCMQPYSDTTQNNAGQRIIGTLTGAVYGLAFLSVLHMTDWKEPILVYLLASIMIIPVIYTTVLIHKKNASFFSCVVFLSIALTHSFDEEPYLFVLNRVLDTFIGVLIGVGINDFHLPVRRENETLYVSGIDDVLIPSDPKTEQYSKVELNRLIRDGVRFTISTIRTPAELMQVMNGVELNLPVIVMDGAAIYDIREKQYLETVTLPPDLCAEVEELIEKSSLHYFVNAILDTTLLIYYGEFRNDAERELFESHRHSLYRNYVQSSYRNKGLGEKVLYITILADDSSIFALERKLRNRLGERVRITISHSEYAGFLYLKIYSAAATKKEMLKKLRKYINTDRIVTLGSLKEEYDVYICDGGGNKTIKTIKKLYQNDAKK